MKKVWWCTVLKIGGVLYSKLLVCIKRKASWKSAVYIETFPISTSVGIFPAKGRIKQGPLCYIHVPWVDWVCAVSQIRT